MREHALFALRNLLKSNQASQDYVCVSLSFPPSPPPPPFLKPGPTPRAELTAKNKCPRGDRDAMRPQYRVGEGGELLDLPPPLRKE